MKLERFEQNNLNQEHLFPSFIVPGASDIYQSADQYDKVTLNIIPLGTHYSNQLHFILVPLSGFITLGSTGLLISGCMYSCFRIVLNSSWQARWAMPYVINKCFVGYSLSRTIFWPTGLYGKILYIFGLTEEICYWNSHYLHSLIFNF